MAVAHIRIQNPTITAYAIVVNRTMGDVLLNVITTKKGIADSKMGKRWAYIVSTAQSNASYKSNTPKHYKPDLQLSTKNIKKWKLNFLCSVLNV